MAGTGSRSERTRSRNPRPWSCPPGTNRVADVEGNPQWKHRTRSRSAGRPKARRSARAMLKSSSPGKVPGWSGNAKTGSSRITRTARSPGKSGTTARTATGRLNDAILRLANRTSDPNLNGGGAQTTPTVLGLWPGQHPDGVNPPPWRMSDGSTPSMPTHARRM